MGVDHGRAHIAVAEQFLHGADVGAALRQMGGEGVAQGVHRDRHGQPSLARRELEVSLQPFFMQVVAPLGARTRVDRQLRRREDPVPGPPQRRARVLDAQGIGQLHARPLRRAVGLPDGMGPLELPAQRGRQAARQHHHAIFAAVAVAHDHHVAIEIHILGAQPQALHQAHAGAVEQARQQARCALHGHQQRRHLGRREDHRNALVRRRPRHFVEPHPLHDPTDE